MKTERVDQLAPGTWFQAQNGVIVVKGDSIFREVTKSDGFVVQNGGLWFCPHKDYLVTPLPNFYCEMERLFYLVRQLGYEDSPEAWPEIIGKSLKRLKRFSERVREILGKYHANDQQVYTRLNSLVDQERVSKYKAEKVQKEARLDGVKCVSEDTAHVGPWTTVRACLDCGVLVSGGPTRCKYCVDKIEKQLKRVRDATKLCCSKGVRQQLESLEQEKTTAPKSDFPVLGTCPLGDHKVVQVGGTACCEADRCRLSGILSVEEWQKLVRRLGQT